MRLFSTEFPIRRVPGRASFIAQIIGWLRGTDYSSVFESDSSRELESDYANLKFGDSEELIFRELKATDSFHAIGFRHDFRDTEGRLWRTEAVLSRNLDTVCDDIIRLRTQCIPVRPGAHLEFPKKPHLIKSILRDGWGGVDGDLVLSDQPVWLVDNPKSLKIAQNIVDGRATKHLPVVYISCVSDGKWMLSMQQIENLAYQLGGVAHVVAEPSVRFSFEHKDQTSGGNVYGGTVGLFVPSRGYLRNFYVGWEYANAGELKRAIEDFAPKARSYLPTVGMDWTELQEKALENQRKRDRNRLSFNEAEALYNEEISNIRERNKELQDKIESLQQELSSKSKAISGSSEIFGSQILNMLGPEIYEGEFSDRLRHCASLAWTSIDRAGVDTRSIEFIRKLINSIQISNGISKFRNELNSATNDAKRMADAISALMSRHGFQTSAENKHIKLTPLPGYWGLGPITVAKTPSDTRGLKNLRSEIEKVIGISALK